MSLAMAESTNISSQGNNPLSKKLNKILDNRFDSDKVSSLNRMMSTLLQLYSTCMCCVVRTRRWIVLCCISVATVGGQGGTAPQPALDSILRFMQIRWEVWTPSLFIPTSPFSTSPPFSLPSLFIPSSPPALYSPHSHPSSRPQIQLTGLEERWEWLYLRYTGFSEVLFGNYQQNSWL